MSIASILTSGNDDIYFAEINAGTINCDVLNARSGGGGTSTQPTYTNFISSSNNYTNSSNKPPLSNIANSFLTFDYSSNNITATQYVLNLSSLSMTFTLSVSAPSIMITILLGNTSSGNVIGNNNSYSFTLTNATTGTNTYMSQPGLNIPLWNYNPNGSQSIQMNAMINNTDTTITGSVTYIRVIGLIEASNPTATAPTITYRT
jgi:hypothetical protein